MHYVLLALPWMLLAFAAWLGTQMMRQHGKVLLRLEALERAMTEGMARVEARLDAQPATAVPAMNVPITLPIGSDAPAFDLPDMNGGHKSLADLKGRRVLLTFFNPTCGFCTRMGHDLAALPIDGANGAPMPLVVTTGDPDANRRMVEEFDIKAPVLIQEGMEVANQYHANGTPMGYLINENGQIASEMAVGADALLALASSPNAPMNGAAHVRKVGRPVADSRIKRDGLDVGTVAPDFRLPLVGGGEMGIADLRGKHALLVFSDPHCGPCMALAPSLEEAAKGRPDVAVLMVSRGDLEENRQKIADFGLTFPVVLQKQWEISKLYAMFATPIAYLIDPEGRTLSEPAIGMEPILALLNAHPLETAA